jgi:hypothetical protein
LEPRRDGFLEDEFAVGRHPQVRSSFSAEVAGENTLPPEPHGNGVIHPASSWVKKKPLAEFHTTSFTAGVLQSLMSILTVGGRDSHGACQGKRRKFRGNQRLGWAMSGGGQTFYAPASRRSQRQSFQLVTVLQPTQAMKGITIAWREGSVRCEYRREATGGWLSVFSGEELIAKEPLDSVLAACSRARELSDSLVIKRAKRA